jgi:hypothetical protein
MDAGSDAPIDARPDSSEDAATDGSPLDGGGDGGGREAVINEFVANHTGMDINEYIEVSSDPNTSLAGYTVLVIEGDSGGESTGVVTGVFECGTTNETGHWSTAILNDTIQNGTQAYLLVTGFSGAADADLDTENDGTLDSTPWTTVVDAVAVNDGDEGDTTYGFSTLAFDFDGSEFPIGGASRIPDGRDTDTADDWVRNDFTGAGLPDPMFADAVAGEGLATNTPNTPNR